MKLKTRPNDSDIDKFLDSVDDEKRKEDSKKIFELMKKWTDEKPKMWGDSIVGFGEYHYRYESGREGDWFIVGFSPRKNYFSIYIVPYIEEQEKLMKDLGKFKAGKSCINVKRLEDIDLKVVENLVKISMKKQK